MLFSNEVLHRKVTLNGQSFLQLVLTTVFSEDVFEGLHDDLGHQDRDSTMPLIKQNFFLIRMDTYTMNKVASCERCIRRKASQDGSELVNIPSTTPVENVCLDYLTLGKFKGSKGFEKSCFSQIIFQGMTNQFPQETKPLKQQRGCCSTTTLLIMVSQPAFIEIKVPT